MNIGVAYAHQEEQVWLRLEVPEGSTVTEAIERSGLLQRFPEINLSRQKVGIFGKLAKPDALVKDGDRIEIYRPIIADPATVKRRTIAE
jgi:uncharacterized protein